MSGENPDEIRAAFSPEFTFHAPGVEMITTASRRISSRCGTRSITAKSLEDRRREDNHIACQTTIEGDFVREFTQSPVGSLPPNGQHIVFELTNIFSYDDQGRIEDEYVQTDNRSVLQQLGAKTD